MSFSGDQLKVCDRFLGNVFSDVIIKHCIRHHQSVRVVIMPHNDDVACLVITRI